MRRKQQWAYGITTVPERASTILPWTLKALDLAGFPAPTLFIDGRKPGSPEMESYRRYSHLNLVCRYPQMGINGNWALAMTELYIRNPDATRYALFQDDMVCYRNLREYLESVPYPADGYQNLLTFPSNELAGCRPQDSVGFFRSAETNPGSGFQTGRGAVALVFSQEALLALLSHEDFRNRPRCPIKPKERLDGLIVTCMNKMGWKEYVHNPTLVKHTGKRSTLGHHPYEDPKSWLGEEFDALTLLLVPSSI